MAPALLKPRKFGGSFAGWQSFALPATRQPVNTSTETQSSLSVKLRRYWISVFWSSLEMPWNAITSNSKGNEKLSRQEAPNSVGGVKGECIIMLMMMLLLMMMMMIRRWWCARWGGGRRRRGRKVMMLRRMMMMMMVMVRVRVMMMMTMMVMMTMLMLMLRASLRNRNA